MGGGKRKVCQGICIKDTWTKPKRRSIEGGRWGCLGCGGVVRRKWRQLYLDINKKMKKKLSKQEEQRQNHGYGEHFDGCQMGRGYGEWVQR